MLFGDVGRIVVATPVSGAVSGKMFRAGEDVVRCTELWSLKSQHLRSGNRCTKKGIFTRPFRHSSPAGVASDVEHGGKGPCDSDGTGFARCYGLRRFNQLWIPGRCHRDRRRENRVIPMNHIKSKENGDMKP